MHRVTVLSITWSMTERQIGQLIDYVNGKFR